MAHINEIIVMVKMPATTATITIFSSTTIFILGPQVLLTLKGYVWDGGERGEMRGE
jgi:hypothetical protein